MNIKIVTTPIFVGLGFIGAICTILVILQYIGDDEPSPDAELIAIIAGLHGQLSIKEWSTETTGFPRYEVASYGEFRLSEIDHEASKKCELHGFKNVNRSDAKKVRKWSDHSPLNGPNKMVCEKQVRHKGLHYMQLNEHTLFYQYLSE